MPNLQGSVLNMEHIKKIIDDMVYLNYRFNRERSPEITLDQWRKIYGDRVDVYETWFQADTVLGNV